MTIRKFENFTPEIDLTALVDETALVLGDVIIGKESSIWPGTVVRGDVHSIRIGERTNIQDNSIVHVTHPHDPHPEGFPTHIGNDVTIGHGVILHACTVKNLCLIGMGSILLDGCIIEDNVFLGAGSLVPPGKILESGYLWIGSPVKRVRKLTPAEIEQISYSANYYVELKNRHKKK